MAQIFDFNNYKDYVKKELDRRSKTQRGIRSRLAEAVGCRPGYVTQVLGGKADLSLEQGDLASQFFGHTDEESQFFLLLLIHGRAGTRHLKARIEKQIQQSRERHLDLKNRFQVKTLSEESQAVFYSNWQYLAILTMLSIPRFQTKEAISEHLKLPLKKVAEILAALEQSGLVILKSSRYLPSTYRTHLGKDSPMLSKHHINWRMQSIQSIERGVERDLHYSSVVSISEKDVHIVKERLVQALEEAAKIIAPSPEEKVYSLCLDFFEV